MIPTFSWAVLLRLILPVFFYVSICSRQTIATYVKLTSYCNTAKGEGTCVSSDHCCKTIGGEILPPVPILYVQPTTTTTTTRPSPSPFPASYPSSYSDLSSLDAYLLRNVQNPDNDYKNFAYSGIPLTGRRPQFARALYDVDLPTPPKHLHSSTGTAAGSCSYSQLCCVIPPRIHSDGCQICGRRGGGADKMQLGTASAPKMPALPPSPTFTVHAAPKHAYVVERINAPQTGRRALQEAQRTIRDMRSIRSPYHDSIKNYPKRRLLAFEERIVNGHAAVRNAYCWQVALLTQNGLFGSGTLIARNWVVTTAHKIAGRFLDDFIVALGEYDFNAKNESSLSSPNVFYSTPLQVLLHPDYDPQTYENDIALIRIPDAPCQYDNICTVCLPSEPILMNTPAPFTSSTSSTSTTTTTTTTTTNRPGYYPRDERLFKLQFDPYPAIYEALKRSREKQAFEDTSSAASAVDEEALLNPHLNMTCVMTGWGETLTAQVAPGLQETPVNIVSNEFCRQEFESMDVTAVKIPETMFCASGRATNSGSCDTDGGGPLVCQRQDKSWALVGIIALGLDWCRDRMRAPTMFVNVGLYRQWIVSQLYEPLPTPMSESLTNARPYTAVAKLGARKGDTARSWRKPFLTAKPPMRFEDGNYASIRWQNPLYA